MGNRAFHTTTPRYTQKHGLYALRGLPFSKKTRSVLKTTGNQKLYEVYNLFGQIKRTLGPFSTGGEALTYEKKELCKGKKTSKKREQAKKSDAVARIRVM